MEILDSTTLPLQGSHLIEASAGTGKTHNILRIYLRLLVEKKLPVDKILVMTFTKAATAELRNRLNHFLRLAHATWLTSEDIDIKALSQRVPEKQAKLILENAILQLDEAAIYTIHGFCKRALTQHAFFSGISFNANMEADTSELTLAAAQDWYREFQSDDRFEILYEAWPTPQSFINHWSNAIQASEPLPKPVMHDLDQLVQGLATSWQDERTAFDKHNLSGSRAKPETKALNQSDIDTLDAICEGKLSPNQAYFASDTVKRCFNTDKKKIAMPTAIALVQAIQSNEKATLILIALGGVEFIQAHINKNKDRLDQLDFNDLIIQLKQGLVGDNGEELAKALREQFPAALVDEFQDTDPDQYTILKEIYKQTDESFVCMIGDPKQAIYGFRGGDVFAYLQAGQHVKHRWTMNTNYRSSPSVIEGCNKIFLGDQADLNTDTFGFGIDYRQVLPAPKKTNPIASDASTRSPVQWVNLVPDSDKPATKAFQSVIADWCIAEIINLVSTVTLDTKPVVPGDIALLVRGYHEAELLQTKLQAAGLNSVYLSARANVLQSNEAASLFSLLTGIWQFENDRKFIAALASDWIKLSDYELDQIQQNEHFWARWQAQFEQWREDWQQRGLMSMLLSIMQKHFKSTQSDTDRQLTNMIHLSELLQQESSQYKTPDALLHWFSQAREQESSSYAQQLRLESDDDLIKIVTMHGAKGLEYPIVFIPFSAYHAKPKKAPALYRYHDRSTFEAKLTVTPTDEQIYFTAEEDKAERIRLFYVAATRAINRLYVCVASFASFSDSAIAATLKCQTFETEEITGKVSAQQHASVLTVSEPEVIPRAIATEQSVPTSTPQKFNGHIERDWWLSSFSALTRHVNHSGHSTPDRDDIEKVETRPEDLPLRFRLTKGAEAGNLLHDAFEHADFTAPDTLLLYQQAKDRYSSLAESF
ncbi:MAG: exodeoxyribonuclease V beta subunit, partial [Reinekea sp.]